MPSFTANGIAELLLEDATLDDETLEEHDFYLLEEANSTTCEKVMRLARITGRTSLLGCRPQVTLALHLFGDLQEDILDCRSGQSILKTSGLEHLDDVGMVWDLNEVPVFLLQPLQRRMPVAHDKLHSVPHFLERAKVFAKRRLGAERLAFAVRLNRAKITWTMVPNPMIVTAKFTTPPTNGKLPAIGSIESNSPLFKKPKRRRPR